LFDPPIRSRVAGYLDSRKVHDRLTGRGVPVIERNVTGKLGAAREPLATGTFGTPLLVIEEERVIGYRPDRLAAVRSEPR